MKTLTILLAICLTLPATANNSFNQLFDLDAGFANETADSITSFHADKINLPTSEKINQLNALSQNIDAYIKASPDDPILWFIKGINYSNLAAVHNAEKNMHQVTEFINHKNQAFQQAIKLDASANKLSTSAYATMKHGLPGDLKITAIQKELELGGNGENESYYWFLHWSNINELEKAGRTQEAEQALNNMKTEMSEQGITNPDYRKLTQHIEQQMHNPVTKLAAERPATPPSSETEDEKENDLTTYLFWLLIVIIVIALIVARKYELLMFRKKANK